MNPNAPSATVGGVLDACDTPIRQAVRQRPVDGMNIDAGSTFADVADRPGHTTLVVFLRHYG